MSWYEEFRRDILNVERKVEHVDSKTSELERALKNLERKFDEVKFWLEWQNNSQRIFTNPHDSGNITLSAKDDRDIINESASGKLRELYVETDSKELQIRIELDDMIMEGTIEEFFNNGYMSDYGDLRLRVYDDESTPNRFVLSFEPKPPIEFFHRIKIVLKAGNTSANVKYRYRLLKLKDEFRNFIR